MLNPAGLCAVAVSLYMNRFVLFCFFLIMPFIIRAQTTISGTVYDYDNDKMPLQNVKVRNLNNQETVVTKASGAFTLPAKNGDLLEFSLSGYHVDTLFLIDLKPKLIRLPVDVKNLKEVAIVGAKMNSSIFSPDPNARAPKRVYGDGLEGKRNNDRAGGVKLNLGFGKMKRQSEKERMLEERDQYETEIRENFNERTIAELVKLQGQELKDFIFFYKPSVALVQSERPFNYTYYIVKTYHNWLKIPVGQRKPPPVPKLKRN